MAKRKYYPTREMIELAIFELNEHQPNRARAILREALEDLPKRKKRKKMSKTEVYSLWETIA
jgi:hypothetical protein